MTYKKFTLGDSLAKGFHTMITTGKLSSKIDRGIEKSQKKLFALNGFTADGETL